MTNIFRPFFPFLASDDTRLIPFLAPLRGVPTTCLYIVFMLINNLYSSKNHVIVNHVIVFSVFIGKSKVESCYPQREI